MLYNFILKKRTLYLSVLLVSILSYSNIIEIKAKDGVSFTETKTGEDDGEIREIDPLVEYKLKSGKNVTLRDNSNNIVYETREYESWALAEGKNMFVSRALKGYDAVFERESVMQDKPVDHIYIKDSDRLLKDIVISIKDKDGKNIYNGTFEKLLNEKDNDNADKVKKYFGLKFYLDSDFGEYNVEFKNNGFNNVELIESQLIEKVNEGVKISYSITQNYDDVSDKAEIKMEEKAKSRKRRSLSEEDISPRLAYSPDEIVYTISADDVKVNSNTLNVMASSYDERSEPNGNRGKIYTVDLKDEGISEKHLDKPLKAKINFKKSSVISGDLNIENGENKVLGDENLVISFKDNSIAKKKLSLELIDEIDKKANLSELEKYLRKDGSNINSENKEILKEKLDIGNGEIKKGDSKTVTGDTVYNALKNLDSSFKSAVASSMAMSAIPQVSSDKIFSIGAGTANYGGKGAVAVGVSGQNKNKNFIYKLSGSMSSDKNIGLSAGINYSFGDIKQEYRDYDKEINELKEIIKTLQEPKEVAEVKENKELFFYIDNFEFDKDKISEANLEKIRNIVKLLNENYKDRIIDVIGYTDTKGSDKYNLNLGLKRANSVVKELKNLGLNESFVIRQVASRGYNQIKEGTYSELRRVEIIVR